MRTGEYPGINRRTFLGRYAGSIGTLALAHLLDLEGLSPRASGSEREPAPGQPDLPEPRATSVICLFQHGGPSQMDLFDPKPELTRWSGKPYPGQLEVHFDTKKGNLLASPFRFQKQGQAGVELSELLPHTARVADELTLV